MSLGIVDDALFGEELKRLGVIPSIPNIAESPSEQELDALVGIVQEPVPLGRGEGKENTPEPVRKLVADLAINGTPHKEIISTLQVSQSSISAYSKGATSTATIDRPNPDLHSHVLSTKQRIAKIATRKLRGALASITEEKLKDLSANKAAQLAKDMSAIVKDMTSDEDDGNNKGVQVVVYAPRMQEKESYERVIAHE